MTAPKATPKTNAMPYTGNKDANPKGKATPGAKKLLEILHNKWGFKNLGIYAYRQMRGSTFISVHGTGRAFDAGYKQSQQELVTEICDWLADNHVALGIEEIHQYVWGTHGRGFRCNRDGKPGWKEWDAENNGGPGGYWIHVEVSPTFAQNPRLIVQAWKKTSPHLLHRSCKFSSVTFYPYYGGTNGRQNHPTRRLGRRNSLSCTIASRTRPPHKRPRRSRRQTPQNLTGNAVAHRVPKPRPHR
jgi:hypothetical protein